MNSVTIEPLVSNNNNNNKKWWAAGHRWLMEKAREHFHEWAESEAGSKWRLNRNKSPYYMGYAQPHWMKEARDALGRNDEVKFKFLKLQNL